MDSIILKKFLEWEKSTRDTIDFKKIYVDIADGDIVCGLVLSELVYWYLPDKNGNPNKLRVKRNDIEWIVCSREEWWDRARITKDQIDLALKKLQKKELIFKESHFFARKRQLHIRINWDTFFLLWNSINSNPIENPYREKSKSENHDLLKVNQGNPILLEEYIRESLTPNTEITFTKIKDSDAEKDSASSVGKDLNLNTKTTNPPVQKKDRPRNPIFDATAKYIWGIDSDEELKQMSVEESAGTRIGIIASWLQGKRDKTAPGRGAKAKTVGFISRPASVENIILFSEHCQEKGITPPRDLEKFVEEWRVWASSVNLANRKQENPSSDRAKFFRQYRAEITTNENAGMYANKPAPSFAEWCKQKGLKL